jgi:hypothetical protein
VFPEELVQKDILIAREATEFKILIVNQINKNFNTATLSELAFAYAVAAEGKDKIFKHKFCKKVSSKIAMSDIEDFKNLSFRCILNVIRYFAPYTIAGEECWSLFGRLLDKYADNPRMTLDFNEIILSLEIITKHNILTQNIFRALINDLAILMESRQLNYKDIYLLVYILHSLKLSIPELMDSVVEYYIDRGYDEEELNLLGISSSCKFLKAISELCPNMTTTCKDLFNDACIEFIKQNYKNFTVLQLKRVKEYLNKMQVVKESDDPIVLNVVKEINEAYK